MTPPAPVSKARPWPGAAGAQPRAARAEAGALPAVARKWSWGAFWLTFIWGTKHKAWITWLFLFPFLAPVPQILVGIYSGRKGRQWAWERLEWESDEQYDRVQGKWSFFGFVLGWVVCLVVIGIGAGMTYG